MKWVRYTPLVMLFLFGCVGAEPVIVGPPRHALVYNFSGNGVFRNEYLNFFINVQDDDGINDLAELYIINDDYSIFWQLDTTDWVLENRGDQYWIGFDALRLADENVIPRGDYRIEVYDKGGELARRTFVLPEYPSATLLPISPPGLRYDEQEQALYLESDTPDNEVYWYIQTSGQRYVYKGHAGQVMFTDISEDGESGGLQLNLRQNLPISEFYVYSFSDELEDAYIQTGPFRF